MKYIKRTVYLLLILFAIVITTSVETDFFSNIEAYIPNVEDRFPFVLKISQAIENMTEDIPSISQIIASVMNEPLPIDPDDLATGKYNKKSPMLNFYSDESIGVVVKQNNILSVFGILKDKNMANVLIQLTDAEGDEIDRKIVAVSNKSFEFQTQIKLPEEFEELYVNLYTGEKGYGEFSGFASNYVLLEKNNDMWNIKKSPVAEHNRIMYETGKSISKGLKKTDNIEPDNGVVKAISKQLTEGVSNDYDKLLKIHDWVCSYLYYNVDYVNDSKVAPYKTDEIIESRAVVCLGYANLFASLCRSVGIPCYVVSGYALGIDSEDVSWSEDMAKLEAANHVWNEAYVNGRWIVVDATWDSHNVYENGKMKNAEKVSHLYFDANPEFFSANHKIIEYLDN